MKTSIEKKPNSKIEILIEIPAEDFNHYYQRALLILGKEVKIKGFRPGHVPSNILEKEIDQARVLNQAAQEVIKEKYVQAVLDNNLEVIGRPEIEVLKLAPKNPLIFKAKTTVLPEIKLPDYKKVAASVKREKQSVKEEEVKKAIEWLQKSRSKLTALNREAQKGDFVEVEYWSPQIEKGDKKKDAFILGQGHLIPGFEKELEGMKAGQEKEDISLTIPKDHFIKDLVGKEVKFNLKMTGVFKMDLPEVNDQFAKSLGGFQDLASLRKNIIEGLRTEKEREAKEKLRGEVLEKIINSINWDIPEILIESEQERILNDLKRNISQKLPFEDYLKKIKKTEEELKKSLLEPAQRNARTFLILRGIAKNEKVNVSDKEIGEQIDEMLKKYPDIKTAEKTLDLERLKEYTKERLTNEKVFQLLEKFSREA